jgi:hypothetical protein
VAATITIFREENTTEQKTPLFEVFRLVTHVAAATVVVVAVVAVVKFSLCAP